jgi:hypothetical protein
MHHNQSERFYFFVCLNNKKTEIKNKFKGEEKTFQSRIFYFKNIENTFLLRKKTKLQIFVQIR